MSLMTLRLGVIQAFKVVSAVIIARFLFPEDFAVFGAVATLAAFLQFTVDLGLGGELVQRVEEPDRETLNAAFTLQQLVAWTMVALVWAAAGRIVLWFELSPESAWMLRAYALTMPLLAARLEPSVRLNRDLRFKGFVLAEIIESATLYAVQITMAVTGFRAWSLITAGVAGALSGTMTLSIRLKWFPRLSLAFARLKSAVGFSLPYQLNAALGALRGFIPAWAVLALADSHQSGLVMWCLGLTGLVWQFAYLANRVLFPAFARLQDEREAARRAAGSLLFAGGWLAILLAAVGGALIPALLPVIFGERWIEAIPVLQVLLWATAGLVVSYLTASILNGVGAPGLRLTTILLGGALELALTWLWVPGNGAQGYAAAVLWAALFEAGVALVLLRRQIQLPLSPFLVLAAGAVVAHITATALPNPILSAMSALAILAVTAAGLGREKLALIRRHAIGS